MIKKIRALILDATRYRWLRKQLVTIRYVDADREHRQIVATQVTLDRRVDSAMTKQ